MADAKYSEIFQIGTWTSKNNKASAFVSANDPQRQPRQEGIKNWCRIPPKEGDSTSITKNNRTYHWCNKCNLWNTSHTAETHVLRSQRKPPEQDKHLIPTPSSNGDEQ